MDLRRKIEGVSLHYEFPTAILTYPQLINRLQTACSQVVNRFPTGLSTCFLVENKHFVIFINAYPP